MTLLLTDGFDKYNSGTGQPAQWWGNLLYENTTYTIATPGRTGSYVKAASLTRPLQASEQHATLICGFAFRTQSSTELCTFWGDNKTIAHVTIWHTTTGKIQAYRGPQATGVLLGETPINTTNLSLSTWQYLEVKATLSDTLGVVEIRLNGVVVLTLTNVDTKNAGTGAVFSHFSVGGSGGTIKDIDDFYLLNGAGASFNNYLGAIAIETVPIDGNGALSQFAGSDGNSVDNYLLVNDTLVTSGTYVQGSTNGNIDTYHHAAAALSVGTILGVVVKAGAQLASGGTRSLAAIGREGGVNVQGPSTPLDKTTETGISPVIATKPGGGAWTLADVNAAEFGWSVQT